MHSTTEQHLDVEEPVASRYSSAARAREESWCCPIAYDHRPNEYSPVRGARARLRVGGPSRHVTAGAVVVDLGSGSGKACFLAAQVVRPSGRVIGVDINPDMLQLASRNAPLFAAAVGCENVEFRRKRIQDREHFDFVEPRVPVPAQEAPPFPCAAAGTLLRDPRETKGADYEGADYAPTSEAPAADCGPGSGCC